jgi:hypothetical protein
MAEYLTVSKCLLGKRGGNRVLVREYDGPVIIVDLYAFHNGSPLAKTSHPSPFLFATTAIHRDVPILRHLQRKLLPHTDIRLVI